MDICHVYKHTQKKELGQYPAILTSCLWSITHICSLFGFVAYNACSDWLIPGIILRYPHGMITVLQKQSKKPYKIQFINLRRLVVTEKF